MCAICFHHSILELYRKFLYCVYIQILFTFCNVYSLAYGMSLTKIIGNIWDGGIFDNKFIPEYKCLVFFFLSFFKGGV